MRAAESADAIHAERVVPDHPAPAGEAELALCDHFQLGRVFVADGQPKRAIGLEHPFDAADPFPRPVEILFRRPLVVVDVVFVADIERRIGKGQIDAARGHFLQPLDATAFVDGIQCEHLECGAGTMCSWSSPLFGVRWLATAFQNAKGVVLSKAYRIGKQRQATALQNNLLPRFCKCHKRRGRRVPGLAKPLVPVLLIVKPVFNAQIGNLFKVAQVRAQKQCTIVNRQRGNLQPLKGGQRSRPIIGAACSLSPLLPPLSCSLHGGVSHPARFSSVPRRR